MGTTYVSMASRGRGRGGKGICQVEKPHCTVIGRGSLYIYYQTCNPIILYIFTPLLKGDLIAELDNGKKKDIEIQPRFKPGFSELRSDALTN